MKEHRFFLEDSTLVLICVVKINEELNN